MPLQATWLGRESVERIAALRQRCYGSGPGDRESFLRRTRDDRFADGDVLVLTDGGADVATATSLALTVNFRGTPLPCQGVAWVGTVRSHRRRKIDGRGLASTVMAAITDKARERRQAASLLAPFRVSFYESFGYGIVERQHVWTIPLTILPDGDTGGFTEAGDADFDAALACRARQFEQTHGDVATDAGGLRHWLKALEPSGFRMIDRQGDRVTSQLTLGTEVADGQTTAVVHRPYWDSPAALQRLLSMLGTLRDQYAAARITLPTDLPVQWLLRERQLAHRKVDHPAATCRLITRMQGKVVDAAAVLGALRPDAKVAGSLTVEVRGRQRSDRWRVDAGNGRVSVVAATGPAGLVMDEPVWSAIIFGDLSAVAAWRMGVLQAEVPADVETLAALTAGPLPYCHEYF